MKVSKVSWWWGLFVVIIAGCYQQVPNVGSAYNDNGCPVKIEKIKVPERIKEYKTLNTPCDCPADSVEWPSEPARNLYNLTNGLDDSHKLAVILAADHATINNLETALKAAGVKPPKEEK